MKPLWGAVLLHLVLIGSFAASAQALRLSQVEFDLALPAGAQETFAFTVFNDEPERTTVRISLADWDRALDGENRFFEPNGHPRSAVGWLTLESSQFTLEPEASFEVRFTLAVPTGVEGTYWAALLVEGTPRQVQTPEGTTILVRKRLAVKILETPPGTGTRAGRIAGFEVGGLNPFTAILRFENTGTVNLAAVRGRVELRDASGTLESIPIDDFPVLPGAVRQLRLTSASFKGRVFPAGQYVVLAILDYGAPELLGGQLVLRVPPLALEPLSEEAGLPQDLDEDGLFEDVNGDGTFDADDPVFLGFHLEAPAVQQNVRAFDFDNDGDVDFEDVLALQERWRAQQAEEGQGAP